MNLNKNTAKALFEMIHIITDISKETLIADNRQKEIVWARELLIRVGREYCDLSYPQLGRVLQRDHTSVMNLYRRKRISQKDYEQATKLFSKAVARLNKQSFRLPPQGFYRKSMGL